MNARVILSGLALIAFTSFASAQTGNGCGNENSTGKRTAFVDTNNNGVCDNYEDRKAVRNGMETEIAMVAKARDKEKEGTLPILVTTEFATTAKI